MKRTIFLFSVLLIVGCSITNGQQSESTITKGKYEYLKDSVNFPNSNYHESIDLQKDGEFRYSQRNGSFINLEIKGQWSSRGDTIFLNSYRDGKDTFNPIDCTSKVGEYSFDVKSLEGSAINYSFGVIGQDTSYVLANQYENTIIKVSKNDIKSVYIIHSNGLHSDTYDLQGEKYCYVIRTSSKRYFKNEKWLYYPNKLKPVGLDKRFANYFLHEIND